MITLALETSTDRGSLALLEAGEVVFSRSFLSDRTHSEQLFLSLQEAGITRCDRVVVGLGPGSYSGVRVSIAAAIGLGLGFGAELVGIPSVAALPTEVRRFQVIDDARRNSFAYALVEEGEVVEGPRLMSLEELSARLDPSLPLFTANVLPGFPAATVLQPCAERLGRLAEQGRGIVARGNLEPLYLREPHITQPKSIG